MSDESVKAAVARAMTVAARDVLRETTAAARAVGDPPQVSDARADVVAARIVGEVIARAARELEQVTPHSERKL
jgi:hypothetical protein